MKKLILLAVATVLATSLQSIAQTNTFPTTGAAGIGTTSPDPKAILDVVSTTKGVLIPRMTKAQRDAIATPSTGLLIFQTNNTPGFYYFNGSAWIAVSSTAFSNKTLSNLTAPTKINQNLLPDTTNTIDLGSTLLRYKDVYPTTIKFPDATTQSTAFTPYTQGSGININGNSIRVATTGVNPGTYGTGTTVPVITVDSTGRITSATTSATSLSNSSLSNLTPTAINQSLLPATTNSIDLGSALLRYKDVYPATIKFPDATTQATAFTPYTQGNGININGSSIRVASTGVNPGTYGSGTSVPEITVDSTGRITSAITKATVLTNTSLSNLAPTAINQTLLPATTNSIDLGSSALAWKDVYARGNINTDSVYRINGNQVLSISGQDNLFVGDNAGIAITTGYDNTASGSYALYLNTEGNDNTANGVRALFSNTYGVYNTANGSEALYSNTTGYNNTANGASALHQNTTGSQNTANGCEALISNTTGNFNTANGFGALDVNTTGDYNTANGNVALESNTTGSFNTANGGGALTNNTVGIHNTANGYLALRFNNFGNSNTADGFLAGRLNTTGSNNVFIGDNSDASAGNLNNATAIGSLALVGASNSMVLGSIAGVNGATNSVNVGIGTSSPAKRLHVMVNGTSGGTPNVNAGIVLENNATAYIQMITPNANDNGILFGTTANQASGGIIYNATGSKGFQFRTNGNSTKMVLDSSGQVGIGTTAPAYKLQLSTNSAAKPTSSAWTVPSDMRLKKDVKDFSDGMNVLEKLHPVWFTYTGKAGMPADDKGVGTIAQELKEIAPYMVNEWTYKNDKGEDEKYLGVDYGAMDFVLANAIKETNSKVVTMEKINAELQNENQILKNENRNQQLAIGSLQNEISEMRSCLETLCNSSLETKTQSPQPQTQSYLQQNNPNPFKENTTIGFYISSASSKAMLKIFSMNGEEIKSFIISTKGKGEIEIAGNTLAPGVYTYVLIVDDTSVDTKQMILTN